MVSVAESAMRRASPAICQPSRTFFRTSANELEISPTALETTLTLVEVCSAAEEIVVVLAALNRSFQMEHQDGRFFTMWYGVIEHSTRKKLVWSGGGHPASLLFRGGHPPAEQLDSQNPGIGMCDWDSFEQQEIEIPEGSRLFLYSDRAFEIHKQDGTDWTFDEFVQFLSQPQDPQQHIMDRLVRHVRMLKGADVLDDDFSILELRT
jgi:sigma-B regulation protein RsbU (phosphoserine phosphatase)